MASTGCCVLCLVGIKEFIHQKNTKHACDNGYVSYLRRIGQAYLNLSTLAPHKNCSLQSIIKHKPLLSFTILCLLSNIKL
jgi:hypothetical protein